MLSLIKISYRVLSLQLPIICMCFVQLEYTVRCQFICFYFVQVGDNFCTHTRMSQKFASFFFGQKKCSANFCSVTRNSVGSGCESLFHSRVLQYIFNGDEKGISPNTVPSVPLGNKLNCRTVICQLVRDGTVRPVCRKINMQINDLLIVREGPICNDTVGLSPNSEFFEKPAKNIQNSAVASEN
jgi:hypothetical protein